jgi:hypothetical protein
VRLLYLGTEEAYDRLVDSLDQLGAPDDGDRGLRTDLIPAAPITSFRLPIDLQPQVIEAVVAWLDETLPHPPPDVRPDAPRTGVREEATRT